MFPRDYYYTMLIKS